MWRIRARQRQVVRVAPNVLFIIHYLHMRSSKNDRENWSSQNRTSRTTCYGHVTNRARHNNSTAYRTQPTSGNKVWCPCTITSQNYVGYGMTYTMAYGRMTSDLDFMSLHLHMHTHAHGLPIVSSTLFSACKISAQDIREMHACIHTHTCMHAHIHTYMLAHTRALYIQ